MGTRSQRHKSQEQGYTSSGESEASGVVGGPYPQVAMLLPNTAVHGGADLDVIFTGLNFNEATVIVWNNGDEPTTYIDATHVKTLVKPSTVASAVTVQVGVRNGGMYSNKVPFIFT